MAGYKRVVLADAERIQALVPYVKQVIRALGSEGAWVSDKSLLSDFRELWRHDMTDSEACQQVSLKLGIDVQLSDYVFEVAQRLKDREQKGRDDSVKLQATVALGICFGLIVAFVLFSLYFAK